MNLLSVVSVRNSSALWIFYYYRPQTKFAKVMFLHLSVSHSVHRGSGCLSQCMLGNTPQPPAQEQTPWEQTPPGRHPLRSRHPPGADTPWEQTSPWEQTPPGSRHPPRQTPPGRHLPGSRHPPGQTPLAQCTLGDTGGRYASYWNAYLFSY